MKSLIPDGHDKNACNKELDKSYIGSWIVLST